MCVTIMHSIMVIKIPWNYGFMFFCFSYVVLDIQVPTAEELNSATTFTFPSTSNAYNNTVFNGTVPMIEIPTATILNQMRNEGYFVGYNCLKYLKFCYRKENCHSEWCNQKFPSTNWFWVWYIPLCKIDWCFNNYELIHWLT